MRFPCLSEDLDARRTGYSVPRTPPRRWLAPALEAFRLASLPVFFRKRFLLSQTSDPLQRPHQVLPALSKVHANVAEDGSGSSLEVLRPFSVLETVDRHCRSGSTRKRHPSSTFFGSLRALSPLTPAALFHAAAAPGVSFPFRAFPCQLTLPARHRSLPSQDFLPCPFELGLSPQGFT